MATLDTTANIIVQFLVQGNAPAQANATANAIDNVTKSANKAGDEIENMGRRTKLGMLAGAYTAMNWANKIREGIFAVTLSVNEMQDAMGRVSAVSHGALSALPENFTNALAKMSIQTGQSMGEMGKLIEGLISQGADPKVAMAMGTPMAMFAKISGGTADDVKRLALALQNYQVQGEAITPILSKMAGYGAATAVSMSEFGEIIARSGAQAAAAGISLDELMTLSGILRARFSSATLEADAMRLAFSKLLDIKKAGKALELGGIQFAAEPGKLRPIADIARDLAAAMEQGKATLPELTAIFGERAGGKFLVGLTEAYRKGTYIAGQEVKGENIFGMSKDLLKTYADRNELATQHEMQMNTLVNQWDRLKNAGQYVGGTLFLPLIESITTVLRLITGFINGIRMIAGWLGPVASVVGFFIGSIPQFLALRLLFLSVTMSMGGLRDILGILKDRYVKVAAAATATGNAAVVANEEIAASNVVAATSQVTLATAVKMTGNAFKSLAIAAWMSLKTIGLAFAQLVRGIGPLLVMMLAFELIMLGIQKIIIPLFEGRGKEEDENAKLMRKATEKLDDAGDNLIEAATLYSQVANMQKDLLIPKAKPLDYNTIKTTEQVAAAMQKQWGFSGATMEKYLAPVRVYYDRLAQQRYGGRAPTVEEFEAANMVLGNFQRKAGILAGMGIPGMEGLSQKLQKELEGFDWMKTGAAKLNTAELAALAIGAGPGPGPGGGLFNMPTTGIPGLESTGYGMTGGMSVMPLNTGVGFASFSGQEFAVAVENGVVKGFTGLKVEMDGTEVGRVIDAQRARERAALSERVGNWMPLEQSW